MSQLTTNTASLQEILATVNALPEAGSGGTAIETCTVTMTIPYTKMQLGSTYRHVAAVSNIISLNGNYTIDQKLISSPMGSSTSITPSPLEYTIEVVKNSMVCFFISNSEVVFSTTGDVITLLYDSVGNGGTYVMVKSDATLVFTF